MQIISMKTNTICLNINIVNTNTKNQETKVVKNNDEFLVEISIWVSRPKKLVWKILGLCMLCGSKVSPINLTDLIPTKQVFRLD